MLELVVTATVAFLSAAILVPDLLQLVGLAQRSGAEGMLGARGKVLEELGPTGWVRLRGERWAARTQEPEALPPGETVEVVALEGLTAIVRRAEAEPERADSRSWPVRHPVRATGLTVVVGGGVLVLLV